MKKYLFIFKSELMSNLQYVFNIMTGFIGYFLHLFIFFSLWKYLYSDPNELINGYNMSQMIWYVIITELLWSVVSGRKFVKKIVADVRTGNITYNINKPYNYILYLLSSHLGEISIKAIVYTILGMITGIVFLGKFPPLNFISVLLIIITAILATIINSLLIIAVGLLSFIIEDATPFYWLYSKLILIIGTLFPIEYFPTALQPILKFSPIYVVSYGPANLFVNFNYGKLISILIAQAIYLFISYSACTLLYKKGVKNLNVNGG